MAAPRKMARFAALSILANPRRTSVPLSAAFMPLVIPSSARTRLHARRTGYEIFRRNVLREGAA